MENSWTSPVGQRCSDETTTLFGIDEEDSALKRRRKRRSLGRRVSFAEAPAYHIYARDDEYISPSQERQDSNGSGPHKVPERRSPRLQSKRQAVGSDDKENWRAAVSNFSDDRARRGSKKPLRSVEQTTFSPASGPPSWHSARITSSLAGDDGEISGLVDIRNISSRQKEHVFDEDVTLDSTTFTFKLSQSQNLTAEPVGEQDRPIELAPSIEKNKSLRAGRESPAYGSGENDMSMSYTMKKPIIRPKVVDIHTGPIDGNTDMSITMQVPLQRKFFLRIDAPQQAQALEMLKAAVLTDERKGSSLDARLPRSNSQKYLKILPHTGKEFTEADEEMIASEADQRAGEIVVTRMTHGEVQEETVDLATIPENGGTEERSSTTVSSESAKYTVDHSEALSDIFHGPVACHGYGEEIPGPQTSNGRTEATEIMDVIVSSLSAPVLGLEENKRSAIEPDHNKGPSTSGLWKPVQQEGSAQELLAISPEKGRPPAAGCIENILITSSLGDHREQSAVLTESEDNSVVLTSTLGKDLSEGRDIISAIAKSMHFEGEKDHPSAPASPQALEKVSSSLTAPNLKEEATLTMDLSISPISTAFLAHGRGEHIGRELDRSITMDVPSLQDLLQMDGGDNTVTDMNMDTEVTISRTWVSESLGNSPSKASRSFQCSDGKPMEGDQKSIGEKDLHRILIRSEQNSSHFTTDKLDQDRSITMCIPRLEDIIGEEEVFFPSSQCGFQNSPSFSDRDFSGSIKAAQVPRCSDLLAADSVSPDIAPAWNKSRKSSWVAPPPSSLASTQLGKSEGGGNVCGTPLTDSRVDIVDHRGEPTKDIASVDAAQNLQAMNSSSSEIVGAVGNAGFQIMDATRIRSSENLQTVTPTSISGESMDIVTDITESILHSSSVRLAKTSHEDEIRTPSYSSGDIVGENSENRHKRYGNMQILKVLRDNENESSHSSAQSMDIEQEATNVILHLRPSKLGKLSGSFENRTPSGGSQDSMMMVEDASEPKPLPDPVPSQISVRVENISLTADFKPSQFLSLYPSPVGNSHEEERVQDLKNRTPSPTPRTFDATELINSVLKSAARLASTPQVSLHQCISNSQSRNGRKKSGFTDGAASRGPQRWANYTTDPVQPFSPGSALQKRPHNELYVDRAKDVETPICKDNSQRSKNFACILSPNLSMKNETLLFQHHHLLPLTTTKAVDKNLSCIGQTTEVQNNSLSILRERVTRQLDSGRKVQLGSGNPAKDNSPSTRRNEVEQASSLPYESVVQHVPDKNVGNITVDEFLKLAEVQFSPKHEKSGRFMKNCLPDQAYEVNNIKDAFKLLFLYRPQVMHLEEACSMLKDELQRLRASEARLNEALSASNPPLFSRFQEVGAAEKQRLKEQIHQFRTKCSLEVKRSWLHFRLGLEDTWSVKVHESKKEIQLHAQELREVQRLLEENYNQILNLQDHICSEANEREEYPSDKAAPKPDEENAYDKSALNKIKYLKEQLADLHLSRKVKHERLLKRSQITEETWRNCKERLESSQCRVHDLETKLAENVRLGHSQARGLQIAERPVFHMKEMVNKVSLLKVLQGEWQVRSAGHDMLEMNYSSIIKRRLVYADSVNATIVTKSMWDLDVENIEEMFPGVNAAEAFQQTFTDGTDHVPHKPKSLRSCIQSTRFRVSNFLMLMEEVGRCQDVPNALAGEGVLIIARFQVENDMHLQLEIKFLDCFLSAKFILTLDLRSGQLNGYPFGARPEQVDIKYCPPKISHKLTSAALEIALATVDPGFNRVERLCAAVGSLLTSLKK